METRKSINNSQPAHINKSLICDHCLNPFPVSYDRWRGARSEKKIKGKNFFCCQECKNLFFGHGPKAKVECLNCNQPFEKKEAQIKRNPNHFCCCSCSVSYNNKNKIHGNRRSKLEVWLEEKLPEAYPNLELHFNRKDAINSELDIYIPSLKLAFELNGIFHYEPIYGEEKLNQIQNNDNRKFAACHENGISLCIIDTSKQIRFTEKSSLPFLDIIKQIINSKLTCG